MTRTPPKSWASNIDDGQPLIIPGLGLNFQFNQEVDVVIPQMLGPPQNFLVEEILPDQLMDPENEIENEVGLALPDDLNVNYMFSATEFRMDPGLEDLLGRKHLPGLDFNTCPLDSQCAEADRLWKEFLAPSAEVAKDQVDNGLLQDSQLQKKSKTAAPVGRKQKKKKLDSRVDAEPEDDVDGAGDAENAGQQ